MLVVLFILHHVSDHYRNDKKPNPTVRQYPKGFMEKLKEPNFLIPSYALRWGSFCLLPGTTSPKVQEKNNIPIWVGKHWAVIRKHWSVISHYNGLVLVRTPERAWNVIERPEKMSMLLDVFNNMITSIFCVEIIACYIFNSRIIKSGTHEFQYDW